MILTGLSSTVLCPTTGRHGVIPANFAALGTSPSPLANDADAGDTLTEFLWTLLPPLPGSGTTQVNDLGGYALTGAADGTYSQAYRLLAMPATGAAYVGESTIGMVVGVIAVAPSITVQPQEQSVTEGFGFIFTATIAGAGPLLAQWRKNGTNVGAPVSVTTTASLSGTAVLADSGAVYSFVLTGPGGTVTSSGAALTVAAAPAETLDPNVYPLPLEARVYLVPRNQRNTEGSMNFVIVPGGRATIDKDPDASLVYGIDVSQVLDSGDTLAGTPTAVGSGVTIGAASVIGTIIKARVSSGPAAGTTQGVTFTWQTAGGDVDQRTIYLRGVQR